MTSVCYYLSMPWEPSEQGHKMSAQCFFTIMCSSTVHFQLMVWRKDWQKSWNTFVSTEGNTWRTVCFDSSSLVAHRIFMRPLLFQMFHGQLISARAILLATQWARENWSNEKAWPFHLPLESSLSYLLISFIYTDMICKNHHAPSSQSTHMKGKCKDPKETP